MTPLQLNIPPHNVSDLAYAYTKSSGANMDLIYINEVKVFRQSINAQFADLSKRIFFDFVDYEPYGETPKIEDVREDFMKGTIKIHTTGNDSPVWGKFHNLQFRAIHDYIHVANYLHFTHKDECIAFKKQMEFSLQDRYTKRFLNCDWDLYSAILRSEIVYQSAYKEVYGKFHIDQKMVLQYLF